jgi:Cu2+-containing amine oxidase
VPYGDTEPTHWNKNVFDMGEVGMGFSANPLTLGCDCLGEIYYFDGTVNDSSGKCGHDPECDLHARGRLRNLLEAHRLPHR